MVILTTITQFFIITYSLRRLVKELHWKMLAKVISY